MVTTSLTQKSGIIFAISFHCIHPCQHYANNTEDWKIYKFQSSETLNIAGKAYHPTSIHNNAADRNNLNVIHPYPVLYIGAKRELKKLATINTTCTSLATLYIITAHSHKRNVGISFQNCNKFYYIK